MPVEMEVDTEMIMSSGRGVECLLTDSEGEPLGTKLYLPEKAGRLQLQQTVNTLLKNVINETKIFLVSCISCIFSYSIFIFSSIDL